MPTSFGLPAMSTFLCKVHSILMMEKVSNSCVHSCSANVSMSSKVLSLPKFTTVSET